MNIDVKVFNNTSKPNPAKDKKDHILSKWDLSQECKIGFTSEKSINVINYINRIQDKNHMITS